MNDEARRNYEKELMEDAERIMKEISGNPDFVDVTPPPEMYENIQNAIQAKQEEQELIRLGRIYKKKRKNRKYLVLAAVLVLTLAFGITCMGGTEKIFEKATWMMAGREQTNVDSDGTEPSAYIDEEEAYEEIEEKYGFIPVKLEYLPEHVEFQEATIYGDTQGIYMVYGKEHEASILYMLRPNYRDGSMGRDAEDKLLAEYEEILEDTILHIKKYQNEYAAYRWSVQFEYQDVTYFIWITGVEESEIEKIVRNLYFF